MTTAPIDCERVSARLGQFAQRFDEAFAALFQPPSDVPASLAEAMRYSATASGKRVRPFLVTRCCEIVGGTFEQALGPACAVECVHAFSLVHDDLPAMDDDDLRRGRPTNHKVFGEAMAILAGDALFALAFELIVRHVPDGVRAAAIVGELARGAGWAGMVGGQVADIEGESQPSEAGLVEAIHRRKTAALIAAACRMGVIAAGGDGDSLERLGQYGRHLGMAFQVADDLLDETSTAEQMGKTVGKDAEAGKQTYIRCVGRDETRRIGLCAVQAAIDAVGCFGERAEDLRDLASFCMERTK